MKEWKFSDTIMVVIGVVVSILFVVTQAKW